jgi:hypothetical protein
MGLAYLLDDMTSTSDLIVRRSQLRNPVDGQCLRFAYLVTIYDTLYGPCPLTLHGDDNTPYVLPDQHSLIDLEIFRLLVPCCDRPSRYSESFDHSYFFMFPKAWRLDGISPLKISW